MRLKQAFSLRYACATLAKILALWGGLLAGLPGLAKTPHQRAQKAKTGGAVMQNPSDPDATYDGHKGPGYQAQIAETCGEDNDVQLITGAEVEPAHQLDQQAAGTMLDQLARHDHQPYAMYADSGYGRDENVVEAERSGVDLQSPVAGGPPQPPAASRGRTALPKQVAPIASLPTGASRAEQAIAARHAAGRTDEGKFSRSHCLMPPTWLPI